MEQYKRILLEKLLSVNTILQSWRVSATMLAKTLPKTVAGEP